MGMPLRRLREKVEFWPDAYDPFGRGEICPPPIPRVDERIEGAGDGSFTLWCR